jgi:hypothetical protein
VRKPKPKRSPEHFLTLHLDLECAECQECGELFEFPHRLMYYPERAVFYMLGLSSDHALYHCSRSSIPNRTREPKRGPRDRPSRPSDMTAIPHPWADIIPDRAIFPRARQRAERVLGA